MTMQAMSVDEALSTTRSVRKRLDLTRPVDPGIIIECLTLAQQAPSPSNAARKTGTNSLLARGWSAVVRVLEVEAAAGVPLRALVAVGRDAAGVLEHPG